MSLEKSSQKQGDSAHHDGIEEHDNHLPNWWLSVLFGSIIFSFGYWYYYHTTSTGLLQRQELAADESLVKSKILQKKDAIKSAPDELLALARDEVRKNQGKEIFLANCVACHGQKGEGGIGPNLTDTYSIHGSKPEQIYKIITQGVTEKGMLAWGPVLGDEKVKSVLAFVLSIKNTNVPGKAPQGNKDE